MRPIIQDTIIRPILIIKAIPSKIYIKPNHNEINLYIARLDYLNEKQDDKKEVEPKKLLLIFSWTTTAEFSFASTTSVVSRVI